MQEIPTEISDEGRAAYAEEMKRLNESIQSGFMYSGNPESYREPPYMGWSVINHYWGKEIPPTHPTVRKDLNYDEQIKLFHTQRLALRKLDGK